MPRRCQSLIKTSAQPAPVKVLKQILPQHSEIRGGYTVLPKRRGDLFAGAKGSPIYKICQIFLRFLPAEGHRLTVDVHFKISEALETNPMRG